MTTADKNKSGVDLVPMGLDNMSDVTGQLREAIQAALFMPPEGFPADKEIRISLCCKAILVPEVTVYVTKKSD